MESSMTKSGDLFEDELSEFQVLEMGLVCFVSRWNKFWTLVRAIPHMF